MNWVESTQRFAQCVRLPIERTPHGLGAQFWVLCQVWIVCMLLLMSTLNKEFELSTKSASEVYCGFLTKSLNLRFGCCWFFSAFDFFFFFLEKCLDGYHIIKAFAGSFNIKTCSRYRWRNRVGRFWFWSVTSSFLLDWLPRGLRTIVSYPKN